MGADGSPIPVVLMAATLPLYTLPEIRFGHWAPAPKLKLFCRSRSLNMPNPPRTAILPLPNRSYANPMRGSAKVLAGEKPAGVPSHGSQTKPSGDNTVGGAPFTKPLVRLNVGLELGLYLLGSTE